MVVFYIYVMSLFASLCILKPATYTECIKKTEQIGNRSQICKAADVVKFLLLVDYFGTYDAE